MEENPYSGAQALTRRHECGHIDRLQLRPGREIPTTEKIKEYRDLANALSERRCAKMLPVLGILLVISQRLLHRRRYLHPLHVRSEALNAPFAGEVSEHLDAVHDVTPPSAV